MSETDEVQRKGSKAPVYIAVSIVLICACLAVYESLPQVKARKEFSQGVSAFNRKDYGQAVEYFENAVRIDPTLPNAKRSLADALAQEVKPYATTSENSSIAHRAIDLYSELLRDNPRDLEFIRQIARLHLDLKDRDEVFRWEKRLLEVDPNDATAVLAMNALKPCNNVPNIRAEVSAGDSRTLPTFQTSNQTGAYLNGLLSAVDEERAIYVHAAYDWQIYIRATATSTNSYTGGALAEIGSQKGGQTVEAQDELKRRAAYFAHEWKTIDPCYRRQFAGGRCLAANLWICGERANWMGRHTRISHRKRLVRNYRRG